MKQRPSKIKNYMDIAETVAMRSHDSQTQVGAILVNNRTGAILSTGFNGFVRGAPDHRLPHQRPEKYPYIMHAEQNLITNCARHGISMEDCTVVCTKTPCSSCMRLLWQCGITSVIAKEPYSDFENLREQLDISIELEHTEEGFVRLTYSSKVT